MPGEFDTKPYVEHDPIVGYRYTPNTRRTLPRPGGGNYEMVINAAGIRSTREYAKTKPPGVFRILAFGDSYSAGQFVSNDQRFSELLERRVPQLEVINFGLEGTGTDQQLLIYENVAREYEHDLVMVFPFLQNIRRNLVEARVARDPKTGEEILRPKPRFELADGRLVLKNSPVPAERVAVAQNTAAALEKTDADRSTTNRLKARFSASASGRVLKRLVFALKPWEPFPEYASNTTPAWQLMEAIFKRFRAAAAPRPLVIVPVFYDSYVRFRMALNYLDRFRSMEGPGVHVIDLLPHFRRVGAEAVRCFQEPHDCHFSAYGHLVLADALMAELNTRNLLLRPA
ncbi:MAG TPA: SGNH/GDSL hydrolase family protein [Verrucomicrobiae bacterium]|jgi:carbamoyltransferase